MNRSSEILNYLTQQDGPAEIIIAPNAPPVTRVASGVELALNVVLDPGDVTDTLMALRARSSQPETAAMPVAGSFSFGMPNIGRFRVSYVSQRGSKAMRVVRVPFTLPDVATVSDDTEIVQRLANVLLANSHGVIAISGTSVIANSKLVYAMMRAANEKVRSVMCVVERSLTFLMAHGNSIVVQCELGNDMASLEDGVRSAFLLEPDVIYVGDVWPADQIPSLGRAVDAGMLTILSSVAIGGDEMLRRFAPSGEDVVSEDPRCVRAMVEVIPSEAGKIKVRAGGRIPS